VELLPKRIPHLFFDLEPMVGVAIFFFGFRLFDVQLCLSIFSRHRDYLHFLFAWSAFPFATARHERRNIM